MERLARRLSSVLINYRIYWRTLAAVRQAHFSTGKWAFRKRYSANRTSENFQIVLVLVRTTIPILLLAFSCTAFILGIARLGENLASTFHWPAWITWLFEIVDPNNQSAYDGFLIAITTITGVFLTLYFTGINTVAGTLYARLPERVRNLLLEERVGNVYARLLILLTIVSVLLILAGIVIGFRPKLAVLVVGFLGFVSIQAFAALSARAFRFFDPSSFANDLLWQLGRWSKQATVKGFQWDEPSFQSYYQRQAQEAIKGIKALVEVCHEENSLRQEALAVLLSKIVVFLSIYIERKRRIPSSSRWYRHTPHYLDWYLSSDTSIQLATSTQTEIQPEMKPDLFWVEEEILNLEIRSLKRCLNDERPEVALQVLEGMANLFETLGTEWQVEYGNQLLLRIMQQIGGFFQEPETGPKLTTGKSEKDILALAFLERLSLLPINLLLGFTKQLDGENLEAQINALARANWRQTAAIYQLGMPAQILERLEFVQKRILFEIKSEGRKTSPDWYLKQLVVQPVAESLHRLPSFSVEILNRFYLSPVEQLFEHDDGFSAAVWISQGLQFCSKALVHLSNIRGVTESLEAVRVLPTLPWPETDWEETHKRISEAQNQLLIHLARCIPKLAAADKTENIPDYFGKAVHLSGEWSFKALVANSSELLTELLEHYFNGILMIREKLRAETQDWGPDKSLRAISEPLIDLCELSGYAYFFAELHQEPRLWETCKALWEAFFRNCTWGFEIIAITIAYHQRSFGLTPRSILRTQWKMQVDNLLRVMARTRKPVTHKRGVVSVIPRYLEIIDHPSLLVRVMGGISPEYLLSIYEGLEIFVDLYLISKPEIESLKCVKHGDLLETLERWQKNEESDLTQTAENDFEAEE